MEFPWWNKKEAKIEFVKYKVDETEVYVGLTTGDTASRQE